MTKETAQHNAVDIVTVQGEIRTEHLQPWKLNLQFTSEFYEQMTAIIEFESGDEVAVACFKVF